MARILTTHIATITEMREPHKALAAAGDHPVAIMKNSKCVGYFVPAQIVNTDETVFATKAQVLAVLKRSSARAQPVLDYQRHA